MELGARALDILIALMSTPNEVVSKKDLMARVWPDVTVEEGSLRFHIAEPAQGAGRWKGRRALHHDPGRAGLLLRGADLAVERSATMSNAAAVDAFPHANLPSRLMPNGRTRRRRSQAVGSADRCALCHHRRRRRRRQDHGCGRGRTSPDRSLRGRRAVRRSWNAERSQSGGHGRRLHARAVGSVRRCNAQPDRLSARQANSPDPRHLRASRRSGCGAGGTHHRQPHRRSTSWRRAARRCRSRASTSTRLDALACPPDDPQLTAAALQKFPATQLFVERAVASGARLDFNDADAAIVASICRKLDGVALAIELAARRVESYGLQQTAALLDQRLTLLWLGPRTAPPRQKTLQATLDWSYGLLSELERVVLRRLAVFVGHFTLDAALEVVTSATVDQSVVFGAIDSLVAKSMVATRPIGAMMRYRLLDTTRAYALEISIDDAELADLAVRHATYYRRWLEQTGTEWSTLSTGTERAPHFAGLNNVRAALEWCFGDNGNAQDRRRTCRRRGARLSGDVSAPGMSSLVGARTSRSRRCHARRARGNASSGRPGDVVDVHARRSDAARAALNRSLAIAEERGDALNQLRAARHAAHVPPPRRRFQNRPALRKAQPAVAGTVEDPAAIALAHSHFGELAPHYGRSERRPR